MIDMSSSLSVPPLGSIEGYYNAVKQYPMLTLEEEQYHGRKVRDEGDQLSAATLVSSHLRFVCATARKFKGYGLPEEDIIQEGSIGLMKAVKKFDPDQGVRLVSYAIHWIKAEIHEYVIKNWKIVKIATTKEQRKLFFNLRSMKSNLQNNNENDNTTLSIDEIEYIAKELKVKPRDVIEMDNRMSGIVFSITHEDEDSEVVTDWDVADETYEPSRVIENFQYDQMFSQIEDELQKLNERDRDIINQRWLLPMIGEKKATLTELATKYNISAERVRQLEEKALSKVRSTVTQLERI